MLYLSSHLAAEAVKTKGLRRDMQAIDGEGVQVGLETREDMLARHKREVRVRRAHFGIGQLHVVVGVIIVSACRASWIRSV